MSLVRKFSTKQDELSGSPQQGEPVYLVVGKLRRPHGIAGEMLFEMTSESIQLFNPGNRFTLEIRKTCTELARCAKLINSG